MVIEINDLTTPGKIQEVFRSEYPYLKIELLTTVGGTQVPVPPEKAIGGFRSKHTSGKWKVHPSNNIAEIENAFSNLFGLEVRVLRQSDSYWITADRNNHLTLPEQNKVGKTDASG